MEYVFKYVDIYYLWRELWFYCVNLDILEDWIFLKFYRLLILVVSFKLFSRVNLVCFIGNR